MSNKLAKLSFVIWGGSLVLYFIIYKVLYNLQSLGLSAAALSMSEEMDMKDMTVFWSFPILQSSGIIALLLAYLSFFMGLAGSLFKIRNYAQVHRALALSCGAYIILHLYGVINDAMGDDWRTIFFFNEWKLKGWPDGAEGYNYGIGGFYIYLILGPSYYLFSRTLKNYWLFGHGFIVVFYIGSFIHAYLIGLDLRYYPLMSNIFIFMQIPVVILFSFWLFRKFEKRMR